MAHLLNQCSFAPLVSSKDLSDREGRCFLDSAKPFSFELQNNSVAREFLEMVLCNTVLQCLWRLIGEMYGVSKILITRM